MTHYTLLPCFVKGIITLGIILITISGWLGGEMVFRHGVAVDQQSNVETER